MGRLTVVIGGARSGKSRQAQSRAARLGGDDVLYVATAERTDAEFEARIEQHRAERPAAWVTLEVPRGVGGAVQAHAAARGAAPAVVLVECLTLLANNVLMAAGPDATAEQAEPLLAAEADELLAAIRAVDSEWLLVTNEVGLGLVPFYPVGRLFRDLVGRLNQRLAAEADEVVFMLAGLPWTLKPAGLGAA